MFKIYVAIYVVILFLFSNANALTAEKKLENYQQEKRAHAIFKEIRCAVCSGESINDSNADIAVGLRSLIRSKITEGLSDADIIRYISERYGEVILMKPPFNSATYILWAGPFLILFLSVLFITFYFYSKEKK
jgi:cytochrome c-type biogenesis protein CcmH